MDARTAAIAADAARISQGHALKLRSVQHKYAAQIAAHTRAVERHARKVLRYLQVINILYFHEIYYYNLLILKYLFFKYIISCKF